MFKSLERKKAKSKYRHHEVLNTPEVPEGLFITCTHCNELINQRALIDNQGVCMLCDAHHRLHVVNRIHQVFDEFKVFNHIIKSKDPLQFPKYKEKLEALTDHLGVYDGVVLGDATIQGKEVIAFVMDPNFLMGSMGSVVGEKITRAFERAQKQSKPVIGFTCSGGARMQEGIISLMQMAKTAMAVQSFSESKGLFINVLCDPTTGGVSASFANLADIILAEPKALIGFAGPRVIEDTIKAPLPEGFQSAEFLCEHGFIDAIVHRHDLKATLSLLLELNGVNL